MNNKETIKHAKEVLKNYILQHRIENRAKLLANYFDNKNNNYSYSTKYCKIIRKSIELLDKKEYKDIIIFSYIKDLNSDFIADKLYISRRYMFVLKNKALINFAEVCPIVKINNSI